MKNKIKTLQAKIIMGDDYQGIIEDAVVGYSHIEINGVLYRCLVAVSATGGVWIYPEKKFYTNLQHEVYARLNDVEYQEYLEMQDYAEARYPEPTAEDLCRFFLKFREEFMPLRSITAPAYPLPNITQPAAAGFAPNAEPLGYLVAIPSPAKNK